MFKNLRRIADALEHQCRQHDEHVMRSLVIHRDDRKRNAEQLEQSLTESRQQYLDTKEQIAQMIRIAEGIQTRYDALMLRLDALEEAQNVSAVDRR